MANIYGLSCYRVWIVSQIGKRPAIQPIIMAKDEQEANQRGLVLGQVLLHGSAQVVDVQLKCPIGTHTERNRYQKPHSLIHHGIGY